MYLHLPRWGRGLALGAGAFFLGDLIVGMAAFCVITLPALWYFSLTWVELAGLVASRGAVLGATWQLGLAWVGTVGALPLLAGVVFLALRAFQLPVGLARRLRQPGRSPTL